jgi:hypothetical protein
VKTWFPDWSRRRLERTALAHAIDVSLAYDRDFDPSLTDRLVVSMLRHEFTDYDDDQRVGSFESACAAIAQRFAWLWDECARQVTRRRAMEVEEEDLRSIWEAEERRRGEFRQKRSADSVRAIADLGLGTEVTSRVRGHLRHGTITWRGRKRVEITFTIKSGEVCTHRLYASEVRPLEAG